MLGAITAGLRFPITADNRTGAAFSAVLHDLRDVRGTLASVADRATRMGRQIRNAGTVLSGLGAGVVLAVRGQLNLADEAAKSAQSLGMSVEQFTRLRHAVDLSGLSMESFEGSMRILARNMVDNEGRFDELGISVRDAGGALRSTDAVLAELSSVFATMPNSAEKTALAMELLGRSGSDMIPLINGGRDALQQMMDEADRLGLTISTDTARSAEQFNDNITRLTGNVRGLAQVVTADLAPVLAEWSDKMVGLAAAFQELSPEMRKFIAGATVITAVVGPLVVGLGLLVMSIGAILRPIGWLVRAIGAAGPILKAFGVLIAAITAPAWGWVAVIAAVGAGAALLYKNWDGVAEWFGRAFTRVIDWARNLPSNMAAGIAANNAELVEAVSGLWGMMSGAVTRWGSAAMEWGRGVVTSLRAGIAANNAELVEAVSGLWNMISGAVSGWGPAALEWGRGLVRDLAGGLREMGGALLTAVGELWEIIRAEVASWPAKMMESGRNLVTGLLDGIVGGRDRAEAAAADMANAITDIVNGEFGIQSPSRVFRTIGEFLVEGLAIGIGSATPQAVDATRSLADQVTEAGRDSETAIEKFANGFASKVGPLVRNAKSIGDAFQQMRARVLDSLVNSGLKGLGGVLGTALGVGQGFGGTGFLGRLFGGAFADGAAFRAGSVTPFARGGVVDGPTMFPMRGGTGLMGEAGPEAIMPLARTSSGALGVQVASSGRASGGNGATPEIIVRLALPSYVTIEESIQISGDVAVRVVAENNEMMAEREARVGR
jgi:hypothetical protein